jgi:hypothetical protein
MDASLKLKTITTWILISRQGQVNFIPSLICYAHCTFQVLMETQRLPKWSINPESSALMLCLTTLWLVREKTHTHTLYYYDSKMDCDIRILWPSQNSDSTTIATWWPKRPQESNQRVWAANGAMAFSGRDQLPRERCHHRRKKLCNYI